MDAITFAGKGAPLDSGYFDIVNSDGRVILQDGDVCFREGRDAEGHIVAVAARVHDCRDLSLGEERTEMLDNNEAIFELPLQQGENPSFTLEVTFILDPNEDDAQVALKIVGEHADDYTVVGTDFRVDFTTDE